MCSPSCHFLTEPVRSMLFFNSLGKIPMMAPCMKSPSEMQIKTKHLTEESWKVHLWAFLQPRSSSGSELIFVLFEGVGVKGIIAFNRCDWVKSKSVGPFQPLYLSSCSSWMDWYHFVIYICILCFRFKTKTQVLWLDLWHYLWQQIESIPTLIGMVKIYPSVT